MATLAYQSARLKRLLHEGLSAFGLKKVPPPKSGRFRPKPEGCIAVVRRTVNACLRVRLLISEHKKTPIFKPFGDPAHVNLNSQYPPSVILSSV